MVFNNNLKLQWCWVNTELSYNYFRWTFPVAMERLYYAGYTWGSNWDSTYPDYYNITTMFDHFNGTCVTAFARENGNKVCICWGYCVAIGY